MLEEAGRGGLSRVSAKQGGGTDLGPPEHASVRLDGGGWGSSMVTEEAGLTGLWGRLNRLDDGVACWEDSVSDLNVCAGCC